MLARLRTLARPVLYRCQTRVTGGRVSNPVLTGVYLVCRQLTALAQNVPTKIPTTLKLRYVRVVGIFFWARARAVS
jgi:hypothetical protein